MNARHLIVATLGVLTAAVLWPDLTSDVADLKRRVAELEVRMEAVDGRVPAATGSGGAGAGTRPAPDATQAATPSVTDDASGVAGDAASDPTVGLAASNAVINPDPAAQGVAEVQAETESLEQRFGLKPAAGQTLAERSWTAHVYEATASGFTECVTLAHEHEFLPPGIVKQLSRPDGALDGDKLDAFAVQGCKPFAETALQYNSYEQIRKHVFGQIKIQFKQWSRASGQTVDTEAVFEQWFENTRPTMEAITTRAEAAINVLIEADEQ